MREQLLKTIEAATKAMKLPKAHPDRDPRFTNDTSAEILDGVLSELRAWVSFDKNPGHDEELGNALLGLGNAFNDSEYS